MMFRTYFSTVFVEYPAPDEHGLGLVTVTDQCDFL